MTVANLKGQIKETTGKLTGNTWMEAKGMFENGVAGTKRAVGYVTDVVGSGINTTACAIGGAYKSAKKTISKLF